MPLKTILLYFTNFKINQSHLLKDNRPQYEVSCAGFVSYKLDLKLRKIYNLTFVYLDKICSSFVLDKLDHVLDDSANTRRMVNQLLCSAFKRHQVPGEGLLPAGPKVPKIISYMHLLQNLFFWEAVRQRRGRILFSTLILFFCERNNPCKRVRKLKGKQTFQSRLFATRSLAIYVS